MKWSRTMDRIGKFVSERQKALKILLMVLCLGILLSCAYMAISQWMDDRSSADIYSRMKDLYYDGTASAASNADGQETQRETGMNGGASPASPGPSATDPVPSSPSPGTTPTAEKTKANQEVRISRQAFSKLQAINPDITGWIRIPGTQVDYPVLQGKDNKYYLTRSVNHEVRRSASIFMDYRNHTDSLDFNTILYGHNMKNGSMFAFLAMYKQPGYIRKHPAVYFDTEHLKGRWEIFSVYVTDVGFNYLKTNFQRKEDCKSFIEAICSRSMYDTDIEVAPEDRILTLSTCSYEFDNARTVVHARLIRDQ